LIHEIMYFGVWYVALHFRSVYNRGSRMYSGGWFWRGMSMGQICVQNVAILAPILHQ